MRPRRAATLLSSLASQVARAIREIRLPGQRRLGRGRAQSRVCGWCGAAIAMPAGMASRRGARESSGVSHGICPRCIAARTAALGGRACEGRGMRDPQR